MPVLFSYGTLQTDSVQLSTFGRTLVGQPDALPAFEPDQVRIEDPAVVRALGRSHHANVKPSDRRESWIAGTRFEVTEDELAHADEFEAQFSYRRIAVTLASGSPAWVYVHQPS